MSEQISYYLYALIFPNRKLYIGITRDVERRWKGHLYRARCGIVRFPVYEAFRKYGQDSIIVKTLVILDNLEYAKMTEIAVIDKFKTTNRKYGYNVSPGGDLTSTPSEVGEKISRVKKGRPWSQKTREVMELYWSKPENRKKISERMMGKQHSAEARRKIGVASKKRGTDQLRTPDVIAKRVIAMTGLKRSPEACENIRLGKLGHKQSEETINKRIMKTRGKHRTEQQRNNMSEGRRIARERRLQERTTQIPDS